MVSDDTQCAGGREGRAGPRVTLDRVVEKGFMEKVASKEAGAGDRASRYERKGKGRVGTLRVCRLGQNCGLYLHEMGPQEEFDCLTHLTPSPATVWKKTEGVQGRNGVPSEAVRDGDSSGGHWGQMEMEAEVTGFTAGLGSDVGPRGVEDAVKSFDPHSRRAGVPCAAMVEAWVELEWR